MTSYPIGSPFHAAALSGNINLLMDLGKEFDEAGWRDVINAEDHQGFTVLHRAAEGGSVPVLGFLVERGANIEAQVSGKDPHGWTPLCLAVFANHTGAVDFLQSAGADPSAVLPLGWTPLKVAVTRNHPSAVERLIAAGANVRQPDLDGFMPIHHAAYSGSVEMVILLLEHGADPNAKARDGSTPAMWVEMWLRGLQLAGEAPSRERLTASHPIGKTYKRLKELLGNP